MYCKELNKTFETKKELFAELVANKTLLIEAKKAEIKCSESVQLSVVSKGEVVKGESDNVIYPVINTTNYMDSHGDVHAVGIWDKSISEQTGNIHYVLDHELKVGSVIAYPKNVKPLTQMMNWTDLGVNLPGETQALIYEVKLTGDEPQAFKRALKDGNIENSVRMQYVKVELAVNDAEYEEENKTWLNYIDKVANRERAEENGYFWYVKEAKIIKEGSAVLFGSNDATPILRNIDKQEPTVVTPQINNGVNNKKSNYYFTLHNV